MLLVSGPTFEIAGFIRILCWIVLPVFAGIALLVVFFHYRKKRRNGQPGAGDNENDFVLAAPEQFSHTKADGDYVYFDHSKLIIEYKKRMFYNHARFLALQKDYASLKTKYFSLVKDNSASLPDNKSINMKNLAPQISPDDDAKHPGDVFSVKESPLEKTCKRLEEENRFLQEQISLQTAGDDERERIVNRWKDEIRLLRNIVNDQDHLKDLLDEHKSQIVFLQKQLETRIRNQHLADQQRMQAIAEMEQAQQSCQQLVQQVSDMDMLRAAIKEKEELLDKKEKEIVSGQDHITYLEAVLKEMKQQNELLHAEVMDKKDIITSLNEQLVMEQGKIIQAEQKLESKQQILKRLYKELSAFADAEADPEIPVIEMNPVYVETATQA